LAYVLNLAQCYFLFFSSLFINPEAAKDLYLGLDLSQLLRYGKRHYIGMFF